VPDPRGQQVNGQRRAGLDHEIDALRATDAQVRAQLAAIGAQLAAEKAELATAEASATAANAAFTEAEAAASAARDVAERTRAAVKDVAIQAYLHPPGEVMATVLVSDSIEQASQRQSMLELRAERQSDLLDQRRAALAELEKKEAAAHDAKDAAEKARADQAAAVAQIEASRQQQAGFAAQIDRRLESALAESAGLDELDANIAREVAAQQDALRKQAEAAGVVLPVLPPSSTTSPPRRGSSSGPLPQIPSVSVVNVGGFMVNTVIAQQFGAMLMFFAATGLKLGGGAYRSPAGQIQTRMNNCGTTYYDIYEKPASQCSPPTARPGTSMHELGMAIDFTCNGSLINSRSDPCFIWLVANAATFGLYNLPSEPWHWSTNGH
jgi:hypothetical protein